VSARVYERGYEAQFDDAPPQPERAPDYSPRVDAVLDGEGSARDFTTADWLRLAAAALDQAGKDYVGLRKRVEIAEEEHAEACRLEGWAAE
jgi:hypothetical protein